MSWKKVVLPLLNVIDPKVVEIGNIARACYESHTKPAGFAMFHATRGSEDGLSDTFIVYLSPVAAELCGQKIAETYTLEPCEVPARDEPDIAFVFGDPLMMGQLQDQYQAQSG